MVQSDRIIGVLLHEHFL